VTWTSGNRVQRSIVCGLDGSDGARVALRVAARLAHDFGLRLVVAHVVQPQPVARGLGPTAGQLAALPLETLVAGGEALVCRILEEERLDEAERRVVLGFAADRLADLADDEGAELVVVGSRGRRGFKAAWLGSVSADLIGVARCPVLVVPPGAASDGRQTSSAASAGGLSSPAAR
jgi:nucleotide-binding universal stress UspA family protein